MFIIRLNSETRAFLAELILDYAINVQLFEREGYAVVSLAGHKHDDYHLAEMTCQINMYQNNRWLCQECRKEVERTGEGAATCGHLTFTNLIRRQQW